MLLAACGKMVLNPVQTTILQNHSAFIEPEVGHVPETENEVIADSKTLELLGVPMELGATVPLELNIRTKPSHGNLHCVAGGRVPRPSTWGRYSLLTSMSMRI